MPRHTPALALLLLVVVASSANAAAPPAVLIPDARSDAVVTTPLPPPAPQAPKETSIAGYDIVRATITNVKRTKKKDPLSVQVTLSLAGPPAPVGFYQLNFDVPGCTGGPTWVGAPTQPPAPTGQMHHEAGMRVILVNPGSPSAYVDCISPARNDPWTRYAAFAKVSGSTITWTVPANRFIKAGARLTNIRAYTGTVGTSYQEAFMDQAGPAGALTVR